MAPQSIPPGVLVTAPMPAPGLLLLVVALEAVLPEERDRDLGVALLERRRLSALERGEERIGDEGVAGVIEDATVGVDEVADEAAVTVADPVSRREGMPGGNDLDGQIGDVHPVAGPDR